MTEILANYDYEPREDLEEPELDIEESDDSNGGIEDFSVSSSVPVEHQ